MLGDVLLPGAQARRELVHRLLAVPELVEQPDPVRLGDDVEAECDQLDQVVRQRMRKRHSCLMPRVPHVRLFISRWCAQCERAVALLEQHGVEFETVDVGDPEGCCRLHELTGGASVPQAVVDGRPIGGYDELAALVRGAAISPAAGGERMQT